MESYIIYAKYKEDKGYSIAQGEYFKHVTNFVTMSLAKYNNDLVLSSHLDLCITRYANWDFYSCLFITFCLTVLSFFSVVTR
jgi:hypothetical protein